MKKTKLRKGNFKRIVVHDGSFHTDDVMCVAIAKYINPHISIVRVNPELSTKEYEQYGTIIADVGLGRYDHHQSDAKIRMETGYPYVACSLLLHDCWSLIFHSRSDYYSFERTYILPIELGDDGVVQNPLSAYISSFRPPWNSDEDMEAAFFDAVNVCLDIIKRYVEVSDAKRQAIPIVKKALKNSDDFVVVLDKKMPYKSVLCKSSARFVIYQVTGCDGKFRLRGIEKPNSEFEVKQKLPESWMTSKPDGCVFVHRQRFLAGFDTLEHALDAAESLKGMNDDAAEECMQDTENNGCTLDYIDVSDEHSGLLNFDEAVKDKLKERCKY